MESIRSRHARTSREPSQTPRRKKRAKSHQRSLWFNLGLGSCVTWAFVALLCLVSCSTTDTRPAQFYKPDQNETCVAHWARGDVPLILVYDQPALAPYIGQAALEWNQLIGRDAILVIQVEKLFEGAAFGRIVPIKAVEPLGDGRVGVTSFSYDQDTCELGSAEIKIGMDAPIRILANVISHEVGHMLGLSHSPDPTDTMFYMAHEGPFQVDQETAAKLQELYGPLSD